MHAFPIEPLQADFPFARALIVVRSERKAVEGALGGLGFGEVTNVRVGKLIELEVPDGAREAVQTRVTEMCEKLLANTVIESYQVTLET